MPKDLDRLHNMADRIEPRLVRAILKAVEKWQDAISIEALAERIAAKDVAGAMKLIRDADIENALEPAGEIIRETVMRGGRFGAQEIKDAM